MAGTGFAFFNASWVDISEITRMVRFVRQTHAIAFFVVRLLKEPYSLAEFPGV
jgi:hypothetical protein